ncbi:GIY-YIG nuclease family protein [Methylobacterium oryzae]|uniref:GIY-YIG nuclease family protein n=1 Tax=Methylobacterium oryzae TaxID=334852 RepID=UPI001F1DEEEB|nr:GIY-YIG nuclease family protein [Methylobacterium oryzae]UIN38306.1 GIY-YIG nuclease family protein [Methylobacterium oryzae]
MSTRLSGIYAIIHHESGRHYIGSAVHITRRWSVHRAYLARGSHQNSYFQRAWDKHGKEAFGFFVLELVEPERLIEVEQEWIDRLWAKGLYNRRRDAASNLGVKHRPESIAKMRAAAKGRVLSEAALAAQKVVIATREHTAAEKAARVAHHRGARRSAESIERIRQSALKRSSAHLAAIAASLSRTYVVTAPDGQRRLVTNLKAFCRENDLSQGHLSAVARGERRHHKGWMAAPAHLSPP